MNIKKLIKKRRNKPKFLREDYGKSHRHRIKEQWRKPKGISSTVKIKKRGKRHPAEIGYKSPKVISGLHPSGVKVSFVSNVNSAKQLKKGTAVMISSGVGKRKKIEIIKACEDAGLILLNIKDTKKFLENVKHMLQERRRKRESILAMKKENAKKKEKPKKESKEPVAENAEKEPTIEEKKIDIQSKKRSLKEKK